VGNQFKVEGPIPARKISDFTFYRRSIPHWKPGDPSDVEIEVVDPKHGDRFVSGRGLICMCSGNLISITVRIKKRSKLVKDPSNTMSSAAAGHSNKNGYKLETNREEWSKFGPNSLDTLCIKLSQLLGLTQGNQTAHGLLLVTGSTDSAKSLVAQGLIHHYLEPRRKKGESGRRHHLVTSEDPIETLYRDDSRQVQDETGFWPTKISDIFGVDYSPRPRRGNHRGEKSEKDGKASLQEALDDALRQSPAVFYAGELRGDDDLRAAVNFAATGHFIVGTTHAGSLSEAFDRLLSAVDARTPARRGQVVQRILGVIHQKKFKGAVLPTLWRNTPPGIASMVSEGLSSIVPNNPVLGTSPNKNKNGVFRHLSSFGRLPFAEFLFGDGCNEKKKDLLEPGRTELIKQAGLSDLQGI
jgi:hypothetical protein